jgi:hypothetical protein
MDNFKVSEKHKAEAEAQGAEVIGVGRDKNYRLYRLECGHEQEIAITSMRKGEFCCHICQELKLKAEAEAQGAKLLGSGKNAYCRNYLLECGHEQQVHTVSMRKGGFKCQTCQEFKLEEEASAQNAVVVGTGKNYRYRTYRLECGHEQEISTGNMRIGNFCCQTCEDTSRTLPSYVYLLKIRNGSNEWLKLGYAKNVDTRVSQYGLPKTATVEHITAVRFKTGNEAHAFETALHQKYKEHLLTKRKAKALGMEKNGFAECYPVEVLDELLKELTNF